MTSNSGRVCLVPAVSGVGGMVSFKARLEQGLAVRGIKVTYNMADAPYSSILVIGGTRDLIGLRQARRHGIRIVQRLDGMNWIHRRKWTGIRHYLRAEYGNLILSYIRSRLTDRIIYQSRFSHEWWERVHGATEKPWSIVYNGVDLDQYTPNGEGEPPKDHVRILLVEGAIAGGYEWGFETAVNLVRHLNNAHSQTIELMVVGRVSAELQQQWQGKVNFPLIFTGTVTSGDIPKLDRSAHLLYAADVNAACPNSVIEAMACGLPVVAFETGALAELVDAQSGRIVPYGGNPWKLDPPGIKTLVRGADEVLNHQASFRQSARSRAEGSFGLDRMVEGYMEVLGL